jgi:hypothetical protein
MAFQSSTKPSIKLLAGVATTALSLGLVASASAQNSQLDPTFGTMSQGQGFGSASQIIQAGGDIDASGFAPGCNGFIADAPDLIFDYSGDASVLIEGSSDADTTMVIEAPDGQILCNDDFNGLNPGIETSFGEPGRYAIWIGTFEPIQNNTFPDADIILSELADVARPVTPTPNPNATGFNANQPPTFGEVEIGAGFGTQDFTLQAGGQINAFDTNSSCAGFVADVPDYQLTVAPGTGAIDLAITSDVDTTLVVVTPNGAVLCNDDAVDLNPGLQISSPTAGSYAVWVGTYSPIENDFFPDAQLTISTSGASAQPTTPTPTPGPAGSGFNPNQAPTFGEIAVTTGFGSQTFTLQAGGDMDAFGINNACAGFIADVPDYVINYQGGSRGPLDLGVESDEDTTLVVVDPNGQVFCNDDDLDLNPALSIASPAIGNYGVWVGTFNPIQNDFYPDATLTVTAGPGNDRGSVAPGSLGDRLRQTPTFGSVQLNSGFGGHSIDLQAGGALEGATLGQFCNGFVAEAPDYVVSYSGNLALRITATSDDDTTMAVALPNGQVECNDDFAGLNPGLIGPEGLTGDYAIWIGTFNPIEGDVFPAASLLVEEVSTTKTHPSGAINSMSLTAGFTPDPFTTTLAAGGIIDASTVDASCWGNIASTPDFVLNYTAGDWPLRVFVNSDADTTLLMRTPTGEVLCNDDADGLNPALALTAPVSGRYEIFIGTYDPTAGNPNATLAISEILDEKILPDGAVTETSVSAGMTRREFELLAGGSFEAFDTFGNTCNGFVASNPDFVAFVDGGGFDVEFTARSAEDTTLVVRGPDGSVFCDDDSGGDFNPLVLVDGAANGPYEVWLGTFSAVGNAPATLSIRDINAGTGTAPNVPGEGKK